MNELIIDWFELDVKVFEKNMELRLLQIGNKTEIIAIFILS